MTVIPEDQRDGRVTLRDLARVEQAQERLFARIEQLRTEVEAKFDGHETQHKTERKERRGHLNWAVTTIMSGAAFLVGTAVAIWAALQP